MARARYWHVVALIVAVGVLVAFLAGLSLGVGIVPALPIRGGEGTAPAFDWLGSVTDIVAVLIAFVGVPWAVLAFSDDKARREAEFVEQAMERLDDVAMVKTAAEIYQIDPKRLPPKYPDEFGRYLNLLERIAVKAEMVGGEAIVAERMGEGFLRVRSRLDEMIRANRTERGRYADHLDKVCAAIILHKLGSQPVRMWGRFGSNTPTPSLHPEDLLLDLVTILRAADPVENLLSTKDIRRAVGLRQTRRRRGLRRWGRRQWGLLSRDDDANALRRLQERLEPVRVT